MNQSPYQQPTNYQSQYPGYQPPKKKNKGLIIGLIALGAVLLFCGACGIAMSLGSHASNTGTLTSSTPGTTPITSSNQHFKVADTVAVSSTWKVTVNTVKTNTGDGQFYIPKNGTYVIVNVTLNNISGTEQTASSFGFTMKGSDGTKYDEIFASGLDGVSSPPDGKVEAGGLVKGDLIYDVPISVKSFTFAFSPSLFESGQTIWDLSVS